MAFLASLFVFGVTIFWSGDLFASCYRDHLREAIALNRERLPQYAALTQNRSVPVSQALIAAENRLLVFSWIFNVDLLAERYERQGIGVTCESFIPMIQTPKFKPRFADGPVPASRVYSLESLKIERSLRKALREGGEQALGLEAGRLLKIMNREKRIYCMTRHTLESIARIAALKPRHEAQALRQGLPSPGSLHRLMLKGHLMVLETTHRVDLMALPLNRQGIPIICQDVPHVPSPSMP